MIDGLRNTVPIHANVTIHTIARAALDIAEHCEPDRLAEEHARMFEEAGRIVRARIDSAEAARRAIELRRDG